MIHPAHAVKLRLWPPVIAEKGLHARKRRWAYCWGVISPVIHAERLATVRPGWKALYHHESLHAIEHHALVGLLMLTTGSVVALASALLQPSFPAQAAALSGIGWGGMTASTLCYVWWRREAEVRADVFALEAAGFELFRSFLLMVPCIPLQTTGTRRRWRERLGSWIDVRWATWLYGANMSDRVRRAHRRRLKTKWEGKPEGVEGG